MKTKMGFSLVVLIVLIVSGCGPAGTPGPVSTVAYAAPRFEIFFASFVSASASPRSLGYSYGCGTTSVPPARITFTVSISDPAGLVDTVLIYYKISTSDAFIYDSSVAPDGGAGSDVSWGSGEIKTYEMTSDDLNPLISSVAAGSSSFSLYWWADAYQLPDYKVLAYSDLFEIGLAPFKAPLVATIVPLVIPPFTMATKTPTPLPPTKKPKSPRPACTAEPNNPNCVP